MNNVFIKQHLQKDFKYMKRCSISSVTRRCKLQPLYSRITKIMKTDNIKGCQGHRLIRVFIPSQWKCKLIKLLGKIVFHYSPRLNIHITWHGKSTCLYTQLNAYTCEHTCTKMFMMTLLVTTPNWESFKCPVEVECIKKCGIFIQWNITHKWNE